MEVGGENLALLDEKKGKIKGMSGDSSLSLFSYCVPGGSQVLCMLLCFKVGQPTEEETQGRYLIIPHICIVCYIFQQASHTFVITSDPATPL